MNQSMNGFGRPGYGGMNYGGMNFNQYGQPLSEEEILQEELEEAEQMIRNGASTRQIARKQFTHLGQSDIYKMYRKFGMTPGGDEDDMWLH